jgi:hypothetical protein
MFLGRAIACAMVIVASGAMEQSGAQSATRFDDAEKLSAVDRARVDRAVQVSTERYDEWLGPSAPGSSSAIRLTRRLWASPSSMDLESQVAFALARARLARIPDAEGTHLFLEGVAWHLQSRIVEELFDLTQLQPGHHAVDLPMFGGLVRWGVPSLVISPRGRDERASPQVAHAAAAVATLEQVVGWPALAASLRVLASADPPPRDSAAVRAVLEAALGVPLGWLFAALDPAFHVNFRLVSVASVPVDCGDQRCNRIAITVARDGSPLVSEAARSGSGQIAMRIEFEGGPPATIWWTGAESSRSFTIDTELAPIAVTLDPENAMRVDENLLDQRWRAEPAGHRVPIKSLAAWVVWLQNAALSYGVLL